MFCLFDVSSKGFLVGSPCHDMDDLQLCPSFQRKLLADQRAQWQKILLQALRDSKMILANTNKMEYKLNLYPYLCLLKDREYVDIMIQVIQSTRTGFRLIKTL